MSIIAPCLTVETEEQYKAIVDKIQPFAQRVQVDISDGEFAPVLLLPAEKLWWPSGWIVDVHAMVMHPDDYVDQLISLKPHLIIFHAETDANLLKIFEKIKKYNIKVGVALLKPTVPEAVADIIRAADHVLVFSGDLGHYGGTASLMQLEKVRLIKRINPNVEVGWDGGVGIDNAFTLTQGGVDVLNAGGSLAKAEDPASVYAKLIQEINKQGII
jgi:ribulose-phosphate 3-epimerase